MAEYSGRAAGQPAEARAPTGCQQQPQDYRKVQVRAATKLTSEFDWGFPLDLLGLGLVENCEQLGNFPPAPRPFCLWQKN